LRRDTRYLYGRLDDATVRGNVYVSRIAILAAGGAALVAACNEGNISEPTCDERVIAYSSVRSSAPGESNIFTTCPDGSGERQLTRNVSSNSYPSWSSDRLRIAFQSLRDENWEIYVMNADGSNPLNLTHSQGDPGAAFRSDQHPAWSPDGSRIVFSSSRTGEGDIYVMDPDGDNIERITADPAPDLQPAWSPDGTRIVFASVRDGWTRILVIDTDGTNEIRLTDVDGAHDSHPAWSPNGARIAFQRWTIGHERTDIFLMDPDGTGLVNLTDHSAHDMEPAWSPDGQRILFTSTRDEFQRVFVMNRDGSEVQVLTSGPAEYLTPAWN
jgi:Tol biopolymer transport system component